MKEAGSNQRSVGRGESCIPGRAGITRIAPTCALVVIFCLALTTRADQNVSQPSPVQDAATGPTGSAVPAKAIYSGYRNQGGNLIGFIRCDQSANFTVAALNGSSQVVAAAASKKIYICHASWSVSAAVKVKWTEGTGTNCATGSADLTGQYPLAANGGAVLPFGLNPLETKTAGDALCVNTSAAADIGGVIQYAQF